jgi:hypothetical protein
MTYRLPLSVLRRPLVLATIVATVLLALITRSTVPTRAGTITLPECTRASADGMLAWSSSCAVTSALTITSGLTLTIEPGVEIQFGPTAGLRIEGGLEAHGTQARQIRLLATTDRWPGILVVQPATDVRLTSVTIANATAGLVISQQAIGLAKPAAHVEVRDSLFYSNTIAIDADYSVITGAPGLSLQNNLLTGNGIGLRLIEALSGKVKLNHNSFVGNGIGVQVTGADKLKLNQQWWGSESGPEVSCVAAPLPRADNRDRICGVMLDDAKPWSKTPAGRVLLPAGAGVTVESAVGQGLASDDIQATSIVTLSVPTGTFTQPVDLLVSSRTLTETPPLTQPGVQGTQLSFEITAAAGGQEIHRFAGAQPLRLEIHYQPEDLDRVDPSKLVLYYYNEQLGAWSFAGIRTFPDPANRRVVAHLSHLSRYRIMGAGLNDVWLPLIVR